MASYKAIAGISRAIIGHLEDNCPTLESTQPDCKLFHPADFENPSITEGFSLLLYRVGVNGNLRNLPPRRTLDEGSYRPSLPLDLHYLLTAWATNPERQQRLLGWAMRFLEDRVILPGNLINQYLGEDDKDTFRADEAVEFILDPLSLTDHFNLWDKLKSKLQVSATYVARMVMLDSEMEWTSAPLVQSREIRAREGVTP
ncbi:MAG: DUF4255 domain-containing protein [Gammaproteobacteria bacterium]|nr:DUF4255 domain-containing protein [Gammaproteobacteria bacterium]